MLTLSGCTHGQPLQKATLTSPVSDPRLLLYLHSQIVRMTHCQCVLMVVSKMNAHRSSQEPEGTGVLRDRAEAVDAVRPQQLNTVIPAQESKDHPDSVRNR